MIPPQLWRMRAKKSNPGQGGSTTDGIDDAFCGTIADLEKWGLAPRRPPANPVKTASGELPVPIFQIPAKADPIERRPLHNEPCTRYITRDFDERPWRNWIAHRSSEPRVGGSNPSGRTLLPAI